ncbi:MAG: HD domain-containing protein [Pseudomonadota bacterium]
MSTRTEDSLNADTVVDFIADIFARCGDAEYLGEPVTMAQHMLQGATLAERQGLSETLVVSALLHDIGHFTSEFGSFSMADTEDRYHEEAGARVLERFFPTLVTDCVRHHVAAKRYLCATRPEYHDALSAASVHSLNLQGGPMDTDEVRAFEANPNLEDIVRVRLLDDAGKDPSMVTPDFAHFAPMVQRVVDAHCR